LEKLAESYTKLSARSKWCLVAAAYAY